MVYWPRHGKLRVENYQYVAWSMQSRTRDILVAASSGIQNSGYMQCLQDEGWNSVQYLFGMQIRSNLKGGTKYNNQACSFVCFSCCS